MENDNLKQHMIIMRGRIRIRGFVICVIVSGLDAWEPLSTFKHVGMHSDVFQIEWFK